MRSLLKFIAPHKTIPNTPWRAAHRWQLSPTRVAILFFGLAIFGLGDSLLVQGNVGNAPWTVFAQGLSLKTGFPLGVSTFLISVAVLLIWIPLKEKPGFGTLSNILLIATFIQIGISIFPLQDSLAMGVTFDLLGIILVGIGSSLYITCGLGPGPRDGAMTGIHQATGIRVGRVRLGIEVSVLIVGWLMGGTVGVGTLLFALLIGESIAISLGVVARLTSR
ncbi:COG2364 Predicted membrane protein [Candidatus Nanopelagicaceae bacterium]